MKRDTMAACAISAALFVAFIAGASAGQLDVRPEAWRGSATSMRSAAPDTTPLDRPASGAQDPFLAHADSALARLVQLHREIRDIHPFLARLQPVAIVRGDTLYVFDADSSGSRYLLKSKGPVPFPLPEGIRASFPLSVYGDRPTCIVSPEVFDSLKGYPTIFHEFIHCAQFLTVEPRLKERLTIVQEAMRAKDYSWELNHAFPYQDATFVKDYSAFLDALEKGDASKIDSAVASLRKHLSRTDYEYMAWEEWKEGFARYVENRIRARLGIAANDGGATSPYDQVTFYRGGEMSIGYLSRQDPLLLTDMEKLFSRMVGN